MDAEEVGEGFLAEAFGVAYRTHVDADSTLQVAPTFQTLAQRCLNGCSPVAVCECSQLYQAIQSSFGSLLSEPSRGVNQTALAAR